MLHFVVRPLTVISLHRVMHADLDIVLENRSVRPLHYGIVSERMHMSTDSFHHLVGA